ncbi:MAG: hypothetical protein ACTHK7_10445 [Aureliella sp.]
MQSRWQDETGARWSTRLTRADIKRMKRNGHDMLDPKCFETAFADAVSQVEFLSELHRPQWENRGMAYPQFAERLISSLGEAGDSFMFSFAQYLTEQGLHASAAMVRRAIAAANS